MNTSAHSNANSNARPDATAGGGAQDGMNYAPRAKAERVVAPGEFVCAAVGLDHGHIFGMCTGLADAGATFKWVYDADTAKAQALAAQLPGARVARSQAEVLEDTDVRMVASAAVPADRGPLGLAVQAHGKHYMSDKAPFTSEEQLAVARASAERTKLIWGCCYSERLMVEAAVLAGYLIEDGAIGRVIQVIGTGPHRLSAAGRPAWFFERARYGGILIDIGSHQVEQFLYYSGNSDATVQAAKVANYQHPEYPELEDFGDATLIGANGATNYFRVDWFTPDGLGTWGDGRTFILGTEGYIEMRKYIDVARQRSGNHLFLVDKTGERHIDATGQTGFPYFGRFILDCLNGTETAMPQAHTFKAAELCLACQRAAQRVG